MPKLAHKPRRQRAETTTILEAARLKVKTFVDGWILLAKSQVAVPGLVLGILYINILGLSFPLQGYGREACLSEATIAILFMLSAVIGFVAPVRT